MIPSQDFFLSPPTPPGSSALCLYTSPFFTQVTLWAPNIVTGGHSGYFDGEQIQSGREEGADIIEVQPTQTQGAVEEEVFVYNVFEAPGE